MPKLSELQPKAPNIILYGPVGSGKTAFALTYGEKAQVIDIDDGLMTGIHLNDQFQSQRRSVDVLQCLESNPNEAKAFQKVKSQVIDIGRQLGAGKYPYECLIIDSLTSLADSAIRYVLFNSNMLGQQPQIQHWGLAFTEIENLIQRLRSMKIIVVLIAHDQSRVQDDETVIDIAIQGQKMPSKIARYFDEILYMKPKPIAQGKTDFIIQTKSTSSVVARSRYNLEPQISASIGMKGLLEKMGYTAKGGDDSQ